MRDHHNILISICQTFRVSPRLTGNDAGRAANTKTSGRQIRPLIKRIRRDKSMDTCHANHCIKCTVQQCANHCQSQNYCALDCITVGTHESNPTMDQCTDCKSFQLRK